MGLRIAEGLAAKRRRLGEPGGQPPFGFTRDGGKPPRLVENPEEMALLRKIFLWAAEGRTDREVAARAGLRKPHVSELLTNRVYAGVLRDGSRRPAVIDSMIWERVQESRTRHSRRHRGPTTYRQYLWSGLIRCRACGRRLTGHVERYRHVEACDDFRAARPGRADPRNKGDSYKVEIYDDIAHRVLAHIATTSALTAEVEEAIAEAPERMSDHLQLARIERERQQATRRLEVDRDVSAWRATWDRLDREAAEAAAAEPPKPSRAEVAESLADLKTLFLDAEPLTKHRVIEALFEQIEVLGPNEVWLYPSVEAEDRGWAAAMSGEFQMEVRKTGRGESV